MRGGIAVIDDDVHREAEQFGRVGDEGRVGERAHVGIHVDEQVDVRGVMIGASRDGAEDPDVADSQVGAEGEQLVAVCGKGEGGTVVRRREKPCKQLGGYGPAA